MTRGVIVGRNAGIGIGACIDAGQCRRMLFMYEHKTQPVIGHRAFLARLGGHMAALVPFMAVSLLAGMLGYRFFAQMGWVDAFMNAAMIMGGMGPVDTMPNAGAKIFAGLYALYCGLFVIAATGYLLLPVLHRVAHLLHRG